MVRYQVLQIARMKLQTQLLILISIEFALIISFYIALNITHFKLLKSQLQQNSDSIFKQNSQIIQSNIINWENSYLGKVFYLNGNILTSLHRLYHVTNNQVIKGSLEDNINYQMNYAGTVKIPDPVRIINGYENNDLSYSFMCYTNMSDFENPKTIDEQIGVKLQEQFQSFGQILHSGRIINQFFFQIYVKQEKIYSIYPCLNRKEEIYGFHAEERDWYVELKRNYQSKQIYNTYNYTFTKPMELYTLKKIGLSLVMPLVDKELKLIGGVGLIFMGKELVQSIVQNNFGFQVIYLVSNEGVMIMHPYQTDGNLQPYYIYNETITGFNIMDWVQIQSQTGESSCPIFAEYQSNLKCRYNSLYQQEMIVGSYKIEQFNMVLVMLQSSQQYIKFYKQFKQNLEISLQSGLNNNIVLQVGIYIFLCYLIFKITEILFYPICFLKAQALNMISKKGYHQIYLPKVIQFCMSQEMQELFESFKLLKNKFNALCLKKSAQCQEFENFSFPKTIFKFKLNAENIFSIEQNQNSLDEENILHAGKSKNLFTSKIFTLLNDVSK